MLQERLIESEAKSSSDPQQNQIFDEEYEANDIFPPKMTFLIERFIENVPEPKKPLAPLNDPMLSLAEP